MADPTPVRANGSRRSTLRGAALLLALWAVAPWAQAQEYFERYGLAPDSAAVDLGVQPLGYPSGVLSAVMARDRILRQALETMRQPLKTHAFRRGADMVGLLQTRRLEAGLLGDMPTILAASTGSVWIVGLVKQTATAIVARGATRVEALRGKRMGFVETSSAHYTLLQGLAAAGLDASQVKLVPVQIDAMPDALERGDIDAFAGWEPAPSIALRQDEKNRIVLRGQSSDYFVIEKGFASRSPEAARQLVAGYLRAIEWMRLSQLNLEKAAHWVLADGSAFSGRPSPSTVNQIASISRRELLDIPSAPALVFSPGAPPLKNEFQFLARLGKIAPGARWENVQGAFAYDGLARVMAEPRKYPIASHDYDD